MTEQAETPVAETPIVDERIATACAIARGEIEGPQESCGTLIGGQKDLNAKGKGPWWFRMRMTTSGFEYLSSERLSSGTFLASDRRQTVRGEVYVGDVCVTHDRGGKIDPEGLIVLGQSRKDPEKVATRDVEIKRLRSGMLRITLPDGSFVERSDPRE